MGHLGNSVSFVNRTYLRRVCPCHQMRSLSGCPRLEAQPLQEGKFIRTAVYLLLALLAGLVCSGLALAQSTNLQIDPRNSDARVFLGSSTQGGASINVGVARVEGKINWNTTDPASSLIEFAIYPANQGAPELYPSSKNSEKSYQAAENYVVLRFKSKSIVPLGEDNFRVAGTLSVMRVQRRADYDPSKGYTGPVYSPAVVYSSEGEATFEFHVANGTESASAGRLSNEWRSIGTVRGQDFPELMNAVAVTRWPAFVEQERCIFPSTTGEDFSGPVCTGKTVEPQPRTNLLCQMKSLQGGSVVAVQCPGAPLQNAAGSATTVSAKEAGSGQADNGAFLTDEVNFQLKLQLNRREVERAGLWGQ